MGQLLLFAFPAVFLAKIGVSGLSMSIAQELRLSVNSMEQKFIFV